MPVEIKELVIKAVVNENAGNSAAPSSGPQEGGSQEAMVKLCVEKVLEILKEQKER